MESEGNAEGMGHSINYKLIIYKVIQRAILVGGHREAAGMAEGAILADVLFGGGFVELGGAGRGELEVGPGVGVGRVGGGGGVEMDRHGGATGDEVADAFEFAVGVGEHGFWKIRSVNRLEAVGIGELWCFGGWVVWWLGGWGVDGLGWLDQSQRGDGLNRCETHQRLV